MGETKNLGKKDFLAKIGLHMSPRYTKGLKNTTFWGNIFRIFFSFFFIKIIISDLLKYNGTPLHPLYFQKSKIMIYMI